MQMMGMLYTLQRKDMARISHDTGLRNLTTRVDRPEKTLIVRYKQLLSDSAMGFSLNGQVTHQFVHISIPGQKLDYSSLFLLRG